MKSTAIVLAAGRGSRMNSDIKKQYLPLGGRPVLYYSLAAFQACSLIDEIVLVCGAGEEKWCRETFSVEYGMTKIARITAGGRERYHSVHAGLKAAGPCDFVLIHDGARPFVDEAILRRIFESLHDGQPCVAGMPVKDTIKLSDGDGRAVRTLPREQLWTVQTPQAFEYRLIRDAYDTLAERQAGDCPGIPAITDDAMVLEYICGIPVKLVEGSWQNIKITTPEDLILAELFLKQRQNMKNCVDRIC